MNIIEKVKDIFSKLPNSFGSANKVNIHETTMRRLLDYLKIPRQSFFKNNKKMYNKIEEYKKKYMEKLRE